MEPPSSACPSWNPSPGQAEAYQQAVTALAAALRHLPGLQHRDWDTIAGRLAARGADRSGLTSALSLQCPGPRRPRAGRCGRQHRGDPPAAVGAGDEVPVPAERADQP